jgi:alpha-tubulin suppressor-like RCC1 family protein
MRRLAVAVLCAAVTTLVWAAGAWATTGVLGWGNNESGQLGNGNKQSGTTVWSAGETTELNGSLQVATGGDHTLDLLPGHTVTAWGSGEFGQLGNGRTGTHTLPFPIPSGELSEVEAVASGESFSLALLKSGKVKAWGRNNRGQLGIGFSTGPSKCGPSFEGETAEHEQERACALVPIEVPGLKEVAAIAAGGEFALALLKNGTVKAWGDNEFGKLGSGSSTGPEKCGWIFPDECSRVPLAVEGLEHVVAIAAGETEAYALLESGEVVAWGKNTSGQLGTGSFEGPEKCKEAFEIGEKLGRPCSTKPVAVSELSGVKAIAAGGEFGLALMNSGKVRAWGSNADGQLGDGTTTNRSTPVATLQSVEPEAELSGVGAISAGGKHSLALAAEGGTLRVWGNPGDGALGPGILNNKIASTAATGSLTSISAGERQTLVIGAPGPYVESVSPNHGEANKRTKVIIKGAGFTGAKVVKWGGTEVSFTVLNETEIETETPSSPPGIKQAQVQTGRATTASTSLGDFRYEPSGGTLELGQCTKTVTGKGHFKTGTCTEEVKEGNWNWTPGFAKGGFTGGIAAETTLLLEPTAGSAMTCSGETVAGSWLAPKAAQEIVLRLTGCKMFFGECSSAGAAAGEIVTNPLEGALGFTEKATDKVGLSLQPEGEETPSVFEAKCGEVPIKVTGSVIGLVTSINKMNASFTLKLKQHSGKQAIEAFDEEGATAQTLKMSINGGSPVQAGLALESSLKGEESLEINTVA